MITDEEITCVTPNSREDKKYSHPSYGMIRVSRSSGGNEEPLFGSEIGSNTKMSINIKKAEITQNLGQNWYYGYEDICEVIMSPVQYAELITNPNTEGMPCTIKYTQECGYIKYKGINTQTIYVESELENRVTELKTNTQEIANKVSLLLNKKGTLKKSDKIDITSLIAKLVTEINSNLPFYEKCFKKSIEKQKMEAKTEIESYLSHAITQAGLKTLKNPEVLALVLKDNQ